MDLLGSRLGPYELVSRIGAGGMGEVFRARDTRLDRTVAVKVLPRELADQAELRARFQREARSISRLNHPHICTLHDVGQADGIDYLVMEYLEGQTLAERIARGPLPIDDVLRIGGQIAGALDRAHRAGIIHRDLKPGNIMLTKSGAKLLDFGLARTVSSLVVSTDTTQQMPLTEEGMVVGTYPYMAPEQLAGEEADARSDLFALGVVLYEMLTGVRPFDGSSPASLMAAILSSQPRPPSELQPLTPPALEHVILHCLAKERDERWQSAADVGAEIEWIRRSPAATPATSAPRRRAVPRLLVVALAIAVVSALAATLGMLMLSRRLENAEQPIRSELLLDAGQPLAPFGPVQLSPDETRLAMVIGRPETMIAVRDLATGETKKLAGTERAQYPFWSPDSRRIGFFADGKLRTIGAAGGSVQVVCDAARGRGGSWSGHGVIAFAPDRYSSIYTVSEDGGTPVAATHAGGLTTHRNPLFLPDDKTFLFTVRREEEPGLVALYAGTIDGRPERRVADKASNAVFADGWLVFARDRNLVAQRFDPRTLALKGAVVPLVAHVAYSSGRDLANFSVTASRIVHGAQVPGLSEIVSYDRSGGATAVPVPRGAYRILDLSPGGRTLAVSINDSFGNGDDVWMLQLDRAALSRFTFENGRNLSAVFSPDGKRLATTTGNVGSSVVLHTLAGGATETLLERKSMLLALTGWSNDGRYLIAETYEPGTNYDIEAVSLQGGKQIPVVHSAADETLPALSPSGKWLAYVSTETGYGQVFVTRFPSGDGKWQVTQDDGGAPRWSPDGKQLFFISHGRLAVLDFQDGETPQFGPPAMLPIPAPADVSVTGLLSGYGFTADGRIITTRPAEGPRTAALHLITNWRSLLPR